MMALLASSTLVVLWYNNNLRYNNIVVALLLSCSSSFVYAIESRRIDPVDDNNDINSGSSIDSLFPRSVEEYDGKVLDPNTLFGSPYGGYSRASQSRLASLPLRLPDIIESDHSKNNGGGGTGSNSGGEMDGYKQEGWEDTASYLEISDHIGRRYICRVYHEDELEPHSLKDSMFQPPVLRKLSSSTASTTEDTEQADKATKEEEEAAAFGQDNFYETPSQKSKTSSSSSSRQRGGHQSEPDPLRSGSSSRSGTGGNKKDQSDDNTLDLSVVSGQGANNAMKETTTAMSSTSTRTTTTASTTTTTSSSTTTTKLTMGPSLMASSYHDNDNHNGNEQHRQQHENNNNDDEDVLLHESGRRSDSYPSVSVVQETERRLLHLDGLCVQMHKGWWSYEWCYGKSITQFHIHIEEYDKSTFRVDDISSLGSFSKRTYGFGESNTFSYNKKEHSRVQDTYAHGDMCEVTDGEDRFRKTTVNIQCCSEKYLEPMPSTAVLRDGHPVQASTVLNVLHFIEDPTEICRYYITACTALLCDENDDDDDDDDHHHHHREHRHSERNDDKQEKEKRKENYDDEKTRTIATTKDTGTDDNDSSSSGSSSNLAASISSTRSSKTKSSSSTSSSGSEYATRRKKSSATRKKTHTSTTSTATLKKQGNRETESIREILDRTLGNHCIHSSTGGWWSYEACHGKHVRQFHETLVVNTETGITLKDTDSIYMLGFYDAETSDSFPDNEEWKRVTNVTATGTTPRISSSISSSSKSGNSNSVTRGGNGAYFELEYTKGDVCDNDPDVTVVDASVVMERASSVRYSCGKRYELHVKEDSTCHYVVEITVPDLCHHPLFKSPVSKQQIIKCIPILDEDEEDDNNIDYKEEKIEETKE